MIITKKVLKWDTKKNEYVDEDFDIDTDDPNYEKICRFAEDKETRKRMSFMLKIDESDEKMLEYYLKYHKEPFTEVECHEGYIDELMQKPSINGIGMGKSAEETADLIKRYHKPVESFDDCNRIDLGKITDTDTKAHEEFAKTRPTPARSEHSFLHPNCTKGVG